MRLIPVAAATMLSVGLLAVPAAAASADSAAPATAATKCATSHAYNTVTDGQSVAKVRAEMGSRGNSNGGVARHHGGRSLELTWTECGTLGLISYGVDFEAEDSSQPLTVFGKSTD